MSRTPLPAGSFVAASLMVVLAFVTWALVFRQVPEGNQEALMLLIGILSANVGLVVGFFFGSSHSSRGKDAAMSALAEAVRPAQPEALVMRPGEQATARSTEGGTVISKDEAP